LRVIATLGLALGNPAHSLRSKSHIPNLPSHIPLLSRPSVLSLTSKSPGFGTLSIIRHFRLQLLLQLDGILLLPLL